MTDDLSEIKDRELFELDDSSDCPVGSDADAYDMFSSKFPELIAEGAYVDLVYVVPKLLGLEPDYYWALSVEERDKTHYRGFIPAFKKVNLDNFRIPSIKDVVPVTPFVPFPREGKLYVVTYTEDCDTIISKVRLVFSEDLVRKYIAIPEGRRLIDCYPVKGYDVYNGKYISVFWCIQLDDDEFYMPVDLKLVERLKLPKSGEYHAYFYPISNGDYAIINDTLYKAEIDEEGMFGFEKQQIRVTKKLRAQEDIPLEGDSPKQTQANIIEFQPPNVQPKSQQTTHIIEFNR